MNLSPSTSLDDSLAQTYHNIDQDCIPGANKPPSASDNGVSQVLSPLCQQTVMMEAVSIDEKSEPKEQQRLPLYKDRRRRSVFLGILLAWFFVRVYSYSIISVRKFVLTSFSFARKDLMTRS